MSVVTFSDWIATSAGRPASRLSVARWIDFENDAELGADGVDVEWARLCVAVDRDALEVHQDPREAAVGPLDDVMNRLFEHDFERLTATPRGRSSSPAAGGAAQSCLLRPGRGWVIPAPAATRASPNPRHGRFGVCAA